jgi:hypothetical protein
LLLGVTAMVVIAWGLLVAFKVVKPAPPAQPKPVTIAIDSQGGVHIRESAPQPQEPLSKKPPPAHPPVEGARP